MLELEAPNAKVPTSCFHPKTTPTRLWDGNAKKLMFENQEGDIPM